MKDKLTEKYAELGKKVKELKAAHCLVEKLEDEILTLHEELEEMESK
jgi:hypothetical protein